MISVLMQTCGMNENLLINAFPLCTIMHPYLITREQGVSFIDTLRLGISLSWMLFHKRVLAEL